MFSHRIRLVGLFVFVSFLILALFLFYFQILQFDHYRSLSLKNTIRVIPIKASRGTIYDRKKNPLAEDKISFDLVLIPQEVKDIDDTLKRLSNITGIDIKSLKASYRRNYHFPFVPVAVAVNLDAEKAFSIEERLTDVPGALIWSEPRRIYPNRQAGSHAIGYIGKIARPEFEKLKDYGYSVQDLVGKSGVEKQYDVYLQGEDGGIQVEVDAVSREVARLGFKEPKKGKDLVLTIDIGLQRFTDMLFEEKKGAAILMEAKTGRILTFVSAPEFDPSIFMSGTNKQRQKILTGKTKPLSDRAISSAYPPGSTFKIVIAAAGIATGAVTNSTTFTCKGFFLLGKRKFRCWKKQGHGPQNIIEGITHSCNVFFYNLGYALGAEQIHRYALSFGLGSRTNIDLPGEIKGLVPSPIWKRFFIKEPWYKGDTINYSIGQGYLLVTPIQMLRVVTIVANEGYCPTPFLVEEIEGRRVAQRRDYVTRLRAKVFKPIKKGMFNVVNDPTGTGLYAKVNDMHISAKTGTAQPGTKGDTHAWFVGYLPSEDPKISFVIFLEHGGKGGADPARMVRLIATYIKENKILEELE